MITLGQVGAGIWGQNHIRAFYDLPGCSLKTCCDKNKEVLKKLGTTYNNKLELTTDFEDIIRDRQIDAVVIASPAPTHADLAIKALSAGKHVFVEKPLALNLQDAERVVETAAENKLMVMVGHLLLYHPAVIKLKEYIQKDELGEIFYLYSTRVNLGRIREEENALWSLTSHDISVALFLLEDVPVEVAARGESYLRKGIEDVVFLTLKFKNNIIVHIHASWLDPHKMRRFTVVGSKKMAVFDDMQPSEKIRIYNKGVERKLDFQTYAEYLVLRNGDVNIPHIEMREPLQIECEHFLSCIRNSSRPLSDGQDGIRTVRVLEAAQISLNNAGRPIKIGGSS